MLLLGAGENLHPMVRTELSELLEPFTEGSVEFTSFSTQGCFPVGPDSRDAQNV
jgi:hypothetical protein